MTTMTLAPANTGDQPEPTSYEAGRLDGQLAALTRFPSRRAHAIAAMAEQYDEDYADGYLDGFLDQTAENAAQRLRDLLAPSRP